MFIDADDRDGYYAAQDDYRSELAELAREIRAAEEDEYAGIPRGIATDVPVSWDDFRPLHEPTDDDLNLF